MIIQCPSSPKLIKSMSDLEEAKIIDDILNTLINDVVNNLQTTSIVLKKDLKYVKLKQKLNIFISIQNLIFYFFLKWKILFYFKLFTLDTVYYKTKNNQIQKAQNIHFFCNDKYFKIANLKIYYEYIYTLQIYNDNLIIHFINKSTLIFKKKDIHIIHNLIIKNMNYHIRYNKINYNLSKVIPFKHTISVY